MLDESLKTEDAIVKRVKLLASRKKRELKELHSRMQKRRNRYYLDHYEGEPEEGEERVHIASEMRLVDKAYGLLTSEKPEVKAYPEDETAPGLIESDELEGFLEGVTYEQRRRQGVDPWNLATMDILIDAMACMFTYWDIALDSRMNWESMETGDEEAEFMERYYFGTAEEETQPSLGELPIIIKRRDPMKVLPEEGGNQGRWKWVIYEDKISAIDIETEWAEALEGEPLDDFKGKGFVEKSKPTVTVLDCWSWEADAMTGRPILYNTVIAGNQLIKAPTPMENYKQMPFEIFFCRTTGQPEWERKGLPITAQIEKTTGELEAAWNARMRSAKLHSQLPLTYEGTGPTPTVATGFGKVITLPPDSKFGFMEYRGMPPDYDKMTAMLHAEVEAGGLGSPVMGGMGGKESGYALALRGEAGTLNLVAPQQSLSLAMSNVFQQVCGLAASFAPDHEMRVMGRFENQRKVFALTGEQCQGFFIDVGVSAQFPEDKDRRMAWAVQFASQPPEQRLLDDRTIIEDFMGYKNYQRIKERKLQDIAEAHPSVMASEIAEALRKRGMDHWIAMVFPEVAQPGVEPTEGAPTSVSVGGVPTQVRPQEEMGAMRSQEFGRPPKGRTFPEEEIGEQLGITTA